MAKKPDPELAAAKQAIAASSPSMDALMEKDPVSLTDEQLAAGVKHLRNERALWQLKQERAGKGRDGSGATGDDEEEKPE